ncbi:MAG: hypothetical protein IJ326_07195 [Lachnospiraceae bacterium]|nr:hypothetical protein [Lachnospiraceae bacterium]
MPRTINRCYKQCKYTQAAYQGAALYFLRWHKHFLFCANFQRQKEY